MEGWQKAVGAEKWEEKGRLGGGEIKGAELFDSGADEREGGHLSQQGGEENERAARWREAGVTRDDKLTRTTKVLHLHVT